MKKYFLLSVCLFWSGFAMSQQATQTGEIELLLVHNPDASTTSSTANTTSERVRVNLSGSIQNPYCSTGDWVIILNSEAAKAQYALLLAAYMAGREVNLTGNATQNCLSHLEVIRNAHIN